MPDGHRIYLNYVPVAGLSLRRRVATKFCRASGQEVHLRREPSNKHDPNAIMVLGSWKGWVGRTERQLGYLPAEHAAKLVELDLAQHVRGRLLKTYVGGDDYVEVEIQVIGPKELYSLFAPSPTKKAIAATDDTVLARLDALTEFLMTTPKLTSSELQSMRKAALTSVVDTMISQGKTYGEASGGPDFLNQPEDGFREQLRNIDNDLSAQVDIVDKGCRGYFVNGEIPAPYYPWRIAVILGKLKDKERERKFLAAWCRNFSEGHGARYDELVRRARKLGAIG